MAELNAREREIAELKARLAALESQGAGPPKPLRSSSKGGIVLAALLIGFVVVLIVGVASNHTPSGSASNLTASDTANSIPAPAATPTPTATAAPASTAPANWTYTDDEDAMGRKSHLACTTSTNSVTQSEPYSDVDARLCLRIRPGQGLNVFLNLNGDGQILCGIEGCGLPVRFDGGAITHFSGSESADNSSNIVFIDSERKFLSDIKKSKKVAIEVTLYQNGAQGLTFNSSGLHWP